MNPPADPQSGAQTQAWLQQHLNGWPQSVRDLAAQLIAEYGAR